LPLGQWFREDLRPLSERVMRERLVPGLNYDYVAVLFERHWRGEGEFEEMLWRITALELWYRRWIANHAVKELDSTLDQRSNRRNIWSVLPAY